MWLICILICYWRDRIEKRNCDYDTLEVLADDNILTNRGNTCWLTGEENRVIEIFLKLNKLKQIEKVHLYLWIDSSCFRLLGPWRDNLLFTGCEYLQTYQLGFFSIDIWCSLTHLTDFIWYSDHSLIIASPITLFIPRSQAPRCTLSLIASHLHE